MNIGIIGTRRRDGVEDFLRVLEAYQDVCLSSIQAADNPLLDFTIISGGCEHGGDRFAELIGSLTRTPTKIHRPNRDRIDRKLLAENPRAAYAQINFARNTLIAHDSDVLIACVAPDRMGGTEDTIKKFLKDQYGDLMAVRSYKQLEARAIREGKLVLV